MLFPFPYYFQSLPEGHCIQPIIDTRRSQPIVHHCQPVIVNQSNSHHCQKVIVYSRQLMQSMQLIPLLDDAMPVQLSGNNLQGFRGSADNPQISIQGSMHSMPQEPILDSMPVVDHSLIQMEMLVLDQEKEWNHTAQQSANRPLQTTLANLQASNLTDIQIFLVNLFKHRYSRLEMHPSIFKQV